MNASKTNHTAGRDGKTYRKPLPIKALKGLISACEDVKRIDYIILEKPASKTKEQEFELDYCPICIQATNHGCCKCAFKSGKAEALKEVLKIISKTKLPTDKDYRYSNEYIEEWIEELKLNLQEAKR